MSSAKIRFLILFLVLQTVKCDFDSKWWKHTTIYHVFIWSFKDSNGDGIGDIKGVTMMLDHFVDLGIETIYMSPFYESPMMDMGYDVKNFINVDSRFGTMDDFEELIAEMKKKGLKLIADLVINHSSIQHPWFSKSVDRIHPYIDYYVWNNPKGFDDYGKPIPPNNWMSIFGGSIWEWNEKRKQFYLHQFGIQQPDLNLRSAALKKEINNTCKFWLDKGVAGFRLDATVFYMEDKQLRDEPLIDSTITKIEHWEDLSHIYTNDLWESYEFIHDTIRSFIDQYSQQRGEFERIIVSEAYTTYNFTLAYYGKKDYPIMHFPFNFQFVHIHNFYDASTFKQYLDNWLNDMPKGATANWVSENHDNPRISKYLNKEYMDIIITVSMTAPGVACLYYGQEIGMTENQVREDQKQDHGGAQNYNRDSVRLPMQWDDSLNAGFSSKLHPWLPVNPEYWEINVQAQKNTKISRYNLVKNLSVIRKTKTLKYGSFKSYVLSTWVYAFTRTYKGYETYITVVNLGSETEIIDLHIEIPHLSPVLEVVASSINSGYMKGSMLRYAPKFPQISAMRPISSLVLKTIHKKQTAFTKQNEFELNDEYNT